MHYVHFNGNVNSVIPLTRFNDLYSVTARDAVLSYWLIIGD